MTYYFYTYTTKHRKTNDIDYWSNVWKGDFVSLIEHLRHQSEDDEYYTDFILIFIKEMSKQTYNKLEGTF